MSVGHADPGEHTNVSGQCCHLLLWSGLLLRAVSGCLDQTSCYSQGLSCYHWKSNGCSWSFLHLEVLLRCVGHAAMWGHMGGAFVLPPGAIVMSGPWYQQSSCLEPGLCWYVLRPRWQISMAYVATWCHAVVHDPSHGFVVLLGPGALFVVCAYTSKLVAACDSWSLRL